MKIFFLIFWFVCVACIISLALIPNLIATNNGADKMLHLCVFCILMIWPTMTFENRTPIIAAFAGLLVIGVGIEIAQGFVPGRNQEIMDLVFNSVGIFSGLVIGYFLRDSYQDLLPITRAHTHMKQAR